MPSDVRGEDLDARTDLFSLGVVLFEAAAGVRPFDGAHDVETMQKILDGDRLSLEDVAPNVPAPLREVIERLEKNGKTVRLLPENPEFAPIEIDTTRQPLVIEGIAVGVIRNGRI